MIASIVDPYPVIDVDTHGDLPAAPYNPEARLRQIETETHP